MGSRAEQWGLLPEERWAACGGRAHAEQDLGALLPEAQAAVDVTERT